MVKPPDGVGIKKKPEQSGQLHHHSRELTRTPMSNN